nr:hypothetical protein B0A51_12275 [Rachicladosporium sp. CCFEE 5018]
MALPHHPTAPYAAQNDIYTTLIPAPPRIVVPPPPLDNLALPSLELPTPLNSQTHPPPQITSNAVLDWSYERRREAQAILPNLYLGPMTVAKNEAWLQAAGITMVLGIRQKAPGLAGKLMDSAMAKIRALGIEAETLDLLNNTELIKRFPECTSKINGHLIAQQGQGKVFLFCESGNERAAGVAAAYLMEGWEGVDYIRAMQVVQAQRFCVNFDDGMKRLLQGYWDVVCARRAVAGNGITGGSGSGFAGVGHKQKRRLERDEDDDHEMGQDDLERFGGRSFAPFASD